MREEIRNLKLNSPAAEKEIESLSKKSRDALPSEYLDFLKNSDGGSGFVGQSYVQFLAINEVIRINESRAEEQGMGNIFVFATNGSNSYYGFDLSSEKGTVVMIDKIDDAIRSRLAIGFYAFLNVLASAKATPGNFKYTDDAVSDFLSRSEHIRKRKR